MSLQPAPRPAATTRTAPVEPCLASYHVGAQGGDPFTTADPIMACMGAHFARRAAQQKAASAARLAEARARLRG